MIPGGQVFTIAPASRPMVIRYSFSPQYQRECAAQ
jgi:hypothetical protein